MEKILDLDSKGGVKINGCSETTNIVIEFPKFFQEQINWEMVLPFCGIIKRIFGHL